MRVDDFDFDLPEDRIALSPAHPRDAARLLVMDGTAIRDRVVRSLPDELNPGDMLVFNDTKVFPARLRGMRGQARVEATLLVPQPDGTWTALARPARKFRPGDTVDFQGLTAEVRGRNGGEVRLDFGDADIMQHLWAAGEMPLPPYIAGKRPAGEADRADYQTVYAAREGAVAAPTAGLHFTDELLAALKARGIKSAFVTLHVGAGTFLPVKAEDTADHEMHSEWGEITGDAAAAINAARAAGGRIVPVGTTSLRLLESAADEGRQIHPFRGETDIFITPGYRFRATDGLMTNFHLPKSTLFMLVSALMGLDTMKRAYTHAVGEDYRFYSYGDACLLWPEGS